MKILFNVRVYGILVDNGRILLSDEKHHGRLITKFPGGGLQFGEGPADCVKREFLEELNVHIDVIEHFYTVDFFQPSAFNGNQQVISIYYLVNYKNLHLIPTIENKISTEKAGEDYQGFRWVNLSELTTDEFTFPIDKKVGELIKIKIKDKIN